MNILGIKFEPRNGASRILRFIRGTDLGSSQSISVKQDLANNLNPEVYRTADRRMQEIESQKAFVMKISRHDSYKAGGPC